MIGWLTGLIWGGWGWGVVPRHHRSDPSPSEASVSPICPPLLLFVLPLTAVVSFFSTHHLPRVCLLCSVPPPPTICPLSFPRTISCPPCLASILPPTFFQRGIPYFWPAACLSVRELHISWSSGDSSRSRCLRSCCDQTRGTGHGGAACWQQQPALFCTADVGGSRRKGRTQPCCTSGTYWWSPSGGWCPRRAGARPAWRRGKPGVKKAHPNAARVSSWQIIS